MRSMANNEPLSPFQQAYEKIKKAREELSLEMRQEIRSNGPLPTHVSDSDREHREVRSLGYVLRPSC